ncbi:hypothetical protein ACFQ60_26100 [Streptomyces zhihengii]
MKNVSLAFGAALLLAVASGSSAGAISDSSKRSIGGGVSLQANAWECNLWAKACDWKTSTKVYRGKQRQTMEWVKNVAQITGRGGSVSIGGSGTGVSGSGSAGTHSSSGQTPTTGPLTWPVRRVPATSPGLGHRDLLVRLHGTREARYQGHGIRLRGLRSRV